MKRLLLILMLLASPVWAVQPDEMLDDPVLEARAREVSAGLRCLVCRNQSIDESDAELARDLRLLVRERLLEGDTNAETVEYIVARFGEYVLLRPNAQGANLLLWLAGPALALFGLGMSAAFIRNQSRRRDTGDASDKLSKAEEARLHEIMGD